MQHAYGGGGTSEGHRYEDVSKTVTQQQRPKLEREISAAQRARRQPRDPAVTVGAAGLASAGVGAGLAGSGKRKIKRVNAEVERTSGLAAEAGDRAHSAAANAHGAERARAATLLEHNSTKARQAALAHWEGGNHALPHTTQLKFSTGREGAHTVTKPGSTGHVRARNALANQAHHTDAEAKRLEHQETEELHSAARARGDRARFTRLHEQGVRTQRKVIPKMKARIGAGRGLMAAGGLAAGGAIVHTERKRAAVGKSLEGASLVEIQKMIGFGDFRGAAGRVRGALSRAGKNPELAARIKQAKLDRLTPVKPTAPRMGPVTSRLKQQADLRDQLQPKTSDFQARLAAARLGG